jgi:hypothetical protein
MSEAGTAKSWFELQSLCVKRTKLMKPLVAVGISIALAAGAAAQGGAEAGDDTLRFYLGKSALVVLGEFTSEPFGYSAELGAAHWSADFRIDEVLKGARPAKETVGVDIVRSYWGSIREKNDRDRPAELKLGGKCILFLNAHGSTADVWFGVQPPFPSMIRSLRRLVSEAPDEERKGEGKADKSN